MTQISGKSGLLRVLTAVLILTVGLVAPMYGGFTAKAQSTGTLLDDFESGSNSGPGGVVSGSDAIKGSYSAWGGSPNYGVSDSDASNFSMWFNNGNSGTSGYVALYGGSGSDWAFLDINRDGNFVVQYQDSNFQWNSGVSYNGGQDYLFRIANIDYSAHTFDMELYDVNGNLVDSNRNIPMKNNLGNFNEIQIDGNDDTGLVYDNVRVGGSLSSEITITYPLSGKVTNEKGNEMENVTVTLSDSGSEITNSTTASNGEYSLEAPDGTYNLTAEKPNYENVTKQITVSGSGVVTDFQLEETIGGMSIDVRPFLNHGQSTEYRVIVKNNTGRYNVTGGSTVVSSDVSVVTVDSSNLSIKATDDIKVNNRTKITATYTDSNGRKFTAERNVTVANQTVENLKILPTWNKVGASLGSSSGGVYEPSGTDLTLRVILVAVMIGAATALISRVFAGIAATTLVMVLGWVAGWVGNGIIIVSFMTAMFIGLNIASNIDYSVRT